MSKLTAEEKTYNKWWLSRFDADDYKMIRLYNHHTLVKEYGTANARYTDEGGASDDRD